MELSLLCGSDVLLIIRDQPSQRTLVYNSLPTNDSFNEAVLKNKCTCSYSNEDVWVCTNYSINNCSKMKELNVRTRERNLSFLWNLRTKTRNVSSLVSKNV